MNARFIENQIRALCARPVWTIGGLIFSLAFILCASTALRAQQITLQDAERIAEENNFDLRMLRAQRQVAVETERVRFRDFFPTASVSYRQNRTVAQRDFDNGLYSVQLNVSQPVYDGGRTALAHQIAEIDVRLAGENYTVQRNQLRLQVRQSFLQLQQVIDNVALAKYNTESAQRMFDVAEAKRKQGDITPADYFQIRNELSQRRLEQVRQENKEKDSYVDFAFLLRLARGESVEISKLDLYNLDMKKLEVEEEVLFNLALAKRPDLRQARIDVEKARREYMITEYYYLPTVSLTGRYGKTGATWPPTTVEWGVGFNVTFNIFGSTLRTDGVDNRSRGESSRGYSGGGQLDIYNNPGYSSAALQNEINLRKARQKSEDLLFQVQNEVHRQSRDLNDQRTALELADEGLAVKEMQLNLARRKYQNGELSLQLLFDQENQVRQARSNLIQQRVDTAIAVGKLELSLGLDLDELQLLNFDELKSGPEIEGRSWKPRTKIEIPPARLLPGNELPLQNER